MTPVPGTPKTRAILTTHGFDPDADPVMLEAAIEAHGWRLRVEQESAGHSGRRPRWRALATRAPEFQGHLTGLRPHLMASGPSAPHVLIAVLAKVLEQERAA